MASAPSIPKYNPPTPPAYQPLDIQSVNQAAISADQQAYNLSDTAFAQQNPALAQAQTNFQNQILQDNSPSGPTLPPQVQNQMMTAGLQGAASSMGATGAFGTDSSLGVGDKTAGQSAVARNFGLNVSNYLQQQKQTGEQELALGTSMFPKREYGIGGAGVAQGMITENTNQNNYNWGVYGSQVQNAQFQANQAGQQAGLSAGASNANTSAALGVAGSAVSAAAVAAVV
jgi:hypothetical protein